MDETGKYILNRFGKLKSKRANWDGHWSNVSQLVLPRKDSVWTHSNGEEKGAERYDSSPEHYNELLASALHGMLTNPNQIWYGLTTGFPELDRTDVVRRYLQQLVLRMHQLYNNSNFQTEIHEVYLDICCLGTGPIRVEEDDDIFIRFNSRPIYEFYVAENQHGEVDTAYTELEMTVRQAVQKYGRKIFEEDAQTKELLKDVDKEIKVIQGIEPRKDAEIGGAMPAQFPYASIHVLQSTGLVLKNHGFKEFPILFPRWSKVSGEVYGRSPAMKSLSDIRMLNAMMMDTIVAAQLRTRPPLLLPDDGIMHPFKTAPGALNYRRAGMQDKIEPLDTGTNPGIGLDMIQDVRARVKEGFYVDQLQLAEGPQMTATEVNARVDVQLRFLGPLLGRMHFELLNPLIARTIGIMKRKKLLPPGMPTELENIGVEVFFTSQIARAQRVNQAQDLNRAIATLTPLVQVAPDIMDNFNTDAIVRHVSELYSLPEELLNTSKNKEAIRVNRQQQQMKAQQMAESQAGADVVGKVAPVLQAQQ